jgi:lysophospholipase L1-like esterase
MKQQIIYLLGSIFVIPLLPILYFAGKRVRKEIPQLPEASLNIDGKIEGTDESIEILSLGESTIAGVGVTDHADGIIGGIAKGLNFQTKKTINWKVLARNGYTAKMVNRKLVKRIPEKSLDFIFVGLGGNDTFRLNSPLHFKNNMIQLIENLRSVQPNSKIIILNMPPIADFPAFPKIVKFVLGNLVNLHRQVIQSLPQKFSNVFYINEKILLKDWLSKTGKTELDFFSDGVHPSALTYGIWGQETVEYLVDKKLL